MTEKKVAAPEVDEDEAPRRGDEYRVALASFEGPLDLLLHLIQKHELDILDIPIGFITEKYLEYLDVIRDLTIDVASEYLVMAATLAHIKSKMLLPVVPTDQPDGVDLEELDPREELIRRLLEYQKYKRAAEDIDARGAVGRDVFLRGAPAPTAEGPAPLAAVSTFNLLDAFAKVLARAKIEIQHEVSFDRMSITERIQQLSDLLRERRSCRFEELFTAQNSRIDLVITFLALLEMTKLKMTRLYQTDPLAEIHIELAAGDLPADMARPTSDGGSDEPEPDAERAPEPEPAPDPESHTDPSPTEDPQ